MKILNELEIENGKVSELTIVGSWNINDTKNGTQRKFIDCQVDFAGMSADELTEIFFAGWKVKVSPAIRKSMITGTKDKKDNESYIAIDDFETNTGRASKAKAKQFDATLIALINAWAQRLQRPLDTDEISALATGDDSALMTAYIVLMSESESKPGIEKPKKPKKKVKNKTK